jgi:hypothetical protein
VITPRVIIAMQMWLNLGINIKISMLGTIPMHALWRKVVLFIIKIEVVLLRKHNVFVETVNMADSR